ncbi:MAG: LysR family transcriptional regulator [Sandaracinaceae bacterium]|nr:LysR family transcriptional regulator [Sandaracinaceae bacterium]
MNAIDGRDLDLNLLRVLVAVADAGSVTAAASRLYLTQSAVSAALKRLTTAVGAPLLVKEGRGVALTSRGRRLVDRARPHLDALVRAALDGAEVGSSASATRVVRLGLSDSAESWLLAPLLARLAKSGPAVRIVVVPVQFRTVGEALARGQVELAITVADELPAGLTRRALFHGDFVCLFDPRVAEIGRTLDRARYLAHEHVIVSYNGDLRGVIEDRFGASRNVRVSVPTFTSIGAIVEGSALLATVPRLVAADIRRTRPALATRPVPFPLEGSAIELLGRAALADDEVIQALVAHIDAIASCIAREADGRARQKASKRPPVRR